MKIGSRAFNLRELAGSLGDFGTLLPLAIGYITVCKLNPAGRSLDRSASRLGIRRGFRPL